MVNTINQYLMNKLLHPIYFGLLLLMLVLKLSALPVVGDSLELHVWYSAHNKTGGNGLNGCVVLENISGSTGDHLQFTFALTTGKNQLNSLITMPSDGVKITFHQLNRRPPSVTNCSNKFYNCPWISGISSNCGLMGQQNIVLPQLPADKKIEDNDWYNVRINDTMNVYFEFVSNDNAFYGTVKRTSKGNEMSIDESEKVVIYIRDNPLRLGAILTHSSIIKLIEPNYKNIQDGYYGFTIGSYHLFNPYTRRDLPVNSSQKQRGQENRNFRNYDQNGRVKR